MSYNSTQPHVVKLAARLLVFGLWTVLFGLLILIFAGQLFSIFGDAEVGIFGMEAAGSIDQAVLDGILMVYRGGIATFGLGGLLMACGGMFFVSVSR